MLVRLVMSGRALSVLLDVFCEAASGNLGELFRVRGDSLFEKNHRTHEIISSSSDYFEIGVCMISKILLYSRRMNPQNGYPLIFLMMLSNGPLSNKRLHTSVSTMEKRKNPTA